MLYSSGGVWGYMGGPGTLHVTSRFLRCGQDDDSVVWYCGGVGAGVYHQPADRLIVTGANTAKRFRMSSSVVNRM